MSILVPVVSHGVTLNEVPDRLAFYFEIGECHAGCKGCHSPHLHEKIKKTTLEEMVTQADEAVEKGANAIVLMGGTTNGISDADLIVIINALSGIAPVALYSGSDDTEHDLYIGEHSMLTWLKTGSYHAELGALPSPNTNQKFLKKGMKYNLHHFQYPDVSIEWEDCTQVFQQ